MPDASTRRIARENNNNNNNNELFAVIHYCMTRLVHRTHVASPICSSSNTTQEMFLRLSLSRCRRTVSEPSFPIGFHFPIEELSQGDCCPRKEKFVASWISTNQLRRHWMQNAYASKTGIESIESFSN